MTTQPHPQCDVCRGASHHWFYNPTPLDVGDHACKHCEARGDDCATCGGEDADCPECHGEGVVEVHPPEEPAWVEDFAGLTDDVELDPDGARRIAAYVRRLRREAWRMVLVRAQLYDYEPALIDGASMLPLRDAVLGKEEGLPIDD